MAEHLWHFCLAGLLLADIVAKVSWGGERQFTVPMTRFPGGDVRDQISSFKIDHGPP